MKDLVGNNEGGFLDDATGTLYHCNKLQFVRTKLMEFECYKKFAREFRASHEKNEKLWSLLSDLPTETEDKLWELV